VLKIRLDDGIKPAVRKITEMTFADSVVIGIAAWTVHGFRRISRENSFTRQACYTRHSGWVESTVDMTK
jgi:hypothetical protein